MIFKAALSLLALTLLVSAANADLRVRGCSYNIHEVHVADIRSDNYFQNSLEMTRLAPTHFVGSKFLAEGYTLKVDAVLRNGKIIIRSKISDGSEAAVSMTGSAPLAAKSFTLKAKNLKQTLIESATEMEPVTVFELVEVRCNVGETQLSDRLFDLAN